MAAEEAVERVVGAVAVAHHRVRVPRVHEEARLRALQVTSYKLQATSYKLQVTSYKLQATSYKLQVTSYFPSEQRRDKLRDASESSSRCEYSL